MKKIFVLLLVCMGLSTYAQKTLYIFNFSSYSVEVGSLYTESNTGGYPWFINNQATGITIAPGDTFTLENTTSTTRFPFDSPNSSPYIDSWKRIQMSGGSWTTMTAANVYAAYGNGQRFHTIKFDVQPDLSGGYIGNDTPDFRVEGGPDMPNGIPTWEAIYYENTDPLNPGLIDYVILISDI
ncbi:MULTISPECIES: hypothetical protein [unclassified Flavobacterium]|uniref:hypothetical protein n=1 Tax=unclassified Flavobacterium TaxID=196869 RepID=UPI00260C6C56|nr:hypothetical protein [Flavobacterium sp.]